MLYTITPLILGIAYMAFFTIHLSGMLPLMFLPIAFVFGIGLRVISEWAQEKFGE